MSDEYSVLETKYVMTDGLDYTDARIRTPGAGDIWIRVGGMKTAEKSSEFLIDEAKIQEQGLIRLNGHKRG